MVISVLRRGLHLICLSRGCYGDPHATDPQCTCSKVYHDNYVNYMLRAYITGVVMHMEVRHARPKIAADVNEPIQ